MRKRLFFKKGIFFLTLYLFWVNCLFSFLGMLTKQFDSALNFIACTCIKVEFTQVAISDLELNTSVIS